MADVAERITRLARSIPWGKHAPGLIVAGALGAMLVLLLAAGARLMGAASAIEPTPARLPNSVVLIQVPTPTMQGDCNIGGSNFGVNNCPKTYITPEPIARHINDKWEAQIIAEVPKDKPISVEFAINDNEAYTFAKEILAYVKVSGFLLKKEPIAALMMPGMQNGVSFDRDTLTLIVGPNK